MEDPKKEFKFDYTKYKTTGVTVKQLDEMYAILVAPATNYVTMTVKAVQLILIGVYIFARNKLIDQEMMIQKQVYEQKQNNSTRTEIDGEDMDNV